MELKSLNDLMMLDDILKFKEWVIANNCERVAVESTGV